MSYSMEASYCESHGRWELIVEKGSMIISFNEDKPAEHHFTDKTRAYVHSGLEKDCVKCRKS